jgi:hypothetical protein
MVLGNRWTTDHIFCIRQILENKWEYHGAMLQLFIDLLLFCAESLSWGFLSRNLKFKLYRTVILPVLLYGCETWSLTLMEECRLWLFENGVLRSVFGSKREEVTGKWRKLHNEELSDM